MYVEELLWSLPPKHMKCSLLMNHRHMHIASVSGGITMKLAYTTRMYNYVEELPWSLHPMHDTLSVQFLWIINTCMPHHRSKLLGKCKERFQYDIQKIKQQVYNCTLLLACNKYRNTQWSMALLHAKTATNGKIIIKTTTLVSLFLDDRKCAWISLYKHVPQDHHAQEISMKASTSWL